MPRIWSQCLKELAQFRRDRLTLALAFVLPLAMLLIYGYAIRLEVKNIPLSIQDFDNSFLSRSYVERLFATQQFRPAPQIGSSSTTSLDRGIAKATVVIPPDFSRRLDSGQSVEVQVLVDGTDVNNARIIQNSLRATTRFFNFTRQPWPIRIAPQTRLWFNPGRQESLYIVPGILGVVLWVFPSMLSAIALVREKEQGTIVQIYASDLPAAVWLAGKGLAYFLVAVGETLVVMSVAALLFQIRLQTSLLPLVVSTVIFLATAVAFGLLVGVRASTQNAAVQGTAIAGFLSALLLSGFIYRIENIPVPLVWISKILPARYYILATRDAFVRGTGWAGMGLAPVMIGLVGCLLFLLAVRGLQRMQFPT
jgi:ABC-2 type transport system permease protein